MDALKVSLCGIPDSPVIPASGTFGYGHEFAQWYDINCLGTFSFKGTTLSRLGNPPPDRRAAPECSTRWGCKPRGHEVIREDCPN